MSKENINMLPPIQIPASRPPFPSPYHPPIILSCSSSKPPSRKIPFHHKLIVGAIAGVVQMAATGGYSNSCGEPGFEGTEVSGFRKGAAEEHWEAGVTLTGNIPLPRSFRSLTMIDSPSLGGHKGWRKSSF